MSSNKEDATDRIKAAALTAAKGFGRATAERAATAAVRNVNAYGQKEEGPSRWQERKEAKRQMYLSSTEKQVRLGERKDIKLPGSKSANIAGSHSQCQKCHQSGHWTFECKNERVYISRPSRTQQLKNPKLRTTFLNPSELDYPDRIPEDEPKIEKKSKNKKKKSKRKHSDTESGSEASVFESDSGSDDESSGKSETSSSSSSLSSLDSGEKRRRVRKEKERRRKNKESKSKKHRKRRYSSSSDSSSESESDSESDSEEREKRKKGSKRHSRKH